MEDDLLGRRLVRLQEQGDEQAFDRCQWLILCVGSALLSSNRCSVALPSTGAQSSRRASSLPATLPSQDHGVAHHDR
jgi:hypothetical protein